MRFGYTLFTEDHREAGYDELSIPAVGADQEGLFRFWREEPRPALGS